MNVLIGGKKVTLAAQNALGTGGEAAVTKVGDLAVKVFHIPNQEKGKKLQEMIQKVSPNLPPHVIAPKDLVYDLKGDKVLGFTMMALDQNFEVVASLSKRGHRASTKIGTRQIANMFLQAHRTLSEIHRAGAVVGDLNDLNELYTDINGSLQMVWIDVDSFQIPGYDCDVATEAFLDPKVYGPDIAHPVQTKDGKPRHFSPENDWYSYAVMLFKSLTLVHPYGGIDHTIPTMPKRAVAKKSVFNKSVVYPAKVGYAIEVLSDNMIDMMGGIFDKGNRVVDLKRLEEYVVSLATCNKCNAQYPRERPRCPSCAAISPPVVIDKRMECTAEDILTVDGEIIAICAYGPTIRCISVEGQSLSLHEITERGTVRFSLGWVSPLMDVSLSSLNVATSHRSSDSVSVFKTSDTGITSHSSTTERFSGQHAAIGCSSNYFYRIARGMIMRCSISSSSVDERPLTQGSVGQTWFKVSNHSNAKGDVLFGCSRIFSEHHYFLVVGSSRTDISKSVTDKFAPIGCPIIEENVIFSDRLVVLLRRIIRNGAEYVHTLALDFEGEVVASYMASTADRIAGSSIQGGVVAGKSLLIATSQGLAREKFGEPTDSTPFEKKLLISTEPFVGDESPVVIYRGGLAVAHGPNLRILKMS